MGKDVKGRAVSWRHCPVFDLWHKQIQESEWNLNIKLKIFNFLPNSDCNRMINCKWYQHKDRKYKTVQKLTKGDEIISWCVYENNYIYRVNRRVLQRRSLLSKCNTFSLDTCQWNFIYAHTKNTAVTVVNIYKTHRVIWHSVQFAHPDFHQNRTKRA